MRKTLFLLVLLFSASHGGFSQMNSQSSYLSDFSGSIIKANKANEDAQGSMYLNDVWCPGQIVNMSGKQFDIARMRFNVLLNRVEYEMSGNVYELTIPYKEFSIYLPAEDGTFKVKHFKNNFPASEQQTPKSFYEIVYDGQVKVLRHHKIRISEHAEPLSLVRVKRFNKSSSLYIYHPQKNTVTRISKRKADLLGVLDDKKGAVEEFMKSAKIKKNISEGDVVKVCLFYDGQS